MAIRLGNNVTIREHAWLNCEPNPNHAINLSIGSGCYLGRFIHINARESVTIEDNVLIADRVFITDHHHGCDNLDMPIISQPLPAGHPVRIGQGSWIGIGAAIFPGVTIGQNAIVAANAVVTRDVPDHAVARGVPARMFERLSGAEISSVHPPSNL
jgi:acetyltransferase-like isoleucine patch superfamily enzyme